LLRHRRTGPGHLRRALPERGGARGPDRQVSPATGGGGHPRRDGTPEPGGGAPVSRARSTLRAALLAPANVVALLTAGGASLMTGHPLPALVALGAEAVYLAAVGLVPSWRRAVSMRAGATEDDETERLLSELAESQREHYFVLRDLRDSILENYRKLPGGGVLAASSEAQLAALLTAFLRLLSTLNDH